MENKSEGLLQSPLIAINVGAPDFCMSLDTRVSRSFKSNGRLQPEGIKR